MSNQQGYSQPQLGATFYPGGVDDFYMPEVISPAPQRVMPEVPEHIQDNLAHLELEGDGPKTLSGPQSPTQYSDPRHSTVSNHPARESSLSTTQHHNDWNQDNRYHGNGQGQANDSSNQKAGIGTPEQRRQYSQAYTALDQPTFSPFPKLHNPPLNVPPTDDEKEATLEQARVPVLNSNDPEMQLAWAQDALAYVEVAIQHELRISESQGPRPQTPQVEHQLRVDAINVVSFLAEQHHPKAEFLKGMWLEFGKFGFRVDKKEAFRCYSRAAAGGYSRAEYRIGMQYESSNDAVKAIRHYSRGVEAGDSASNYRIGMMTLLGQHDQKQDYMRGVQLIRLAAQTADENAPQGAYVYGMLQARELPQVNIPEVYLPLDINGARINIEKAAYLGFAKAQVKMGSAYELCQLGCDFNPALSLHYNALAARQGETEAEMAISKWFLCGYDSVFEKNEELAFRYAQRAARSGLPTAEFAIGYFYEIGMYVPVDLKEARNWYGKAAEHGNKDAVGRIDGISRSKTLSKKDHENVAIAKIKSQYGSQRGKRPERFRTPAPPMPTIPDNTVDMPDPSRSRIALGNRQPYPNPYGDNQGPQRPGSDAPYPMDDRPPRLSSRPGPSTGYHNPEMRPSSAFGINPNIRPTSVATNAGISPISNYRGSPGPSLGSQRPHSSLDDLGAGRGRGGPSLLVESGSLGPQGYRQPGALPPGGSPNIDRPFDNASQSQPPMLDIGFSAPLDPTGPDRRRRLQKSDNPNLSKPQPLPPSFGHDAPSDRKSSRIPTVPHSQTFSNDHRTTSPHRMTGRPGSAGRPSRQESLPALSSNKPALLSEPSTPAARIPPAKPSIPATPSSSSTSQLPGKGPKTFEEMGVPQAKTDSDCVLM
ncbi:MAG: hypothetical protein M1830_007385 [Pleopsidium flavum]|nr:MAG: hypothetical protein M1830_007385 [Pleopsidium flavum]